MAVVVEIWREVGQRSFSVLFGGVLAMLILGVLMISGHLVVLLGLTFRRVHLKEGSAPVFEAMQTEGVVQFNKLLRNVAPEDEAAVLACLRKIKANAETAIAEQQ